jgi:hypothetical protein
MAYLLADPDSKLTYAFDWSDWLADGDAISTHLWSIAPSNGDSPETPTLTNSTSATVTVEGFELGRVYRLTDHVTTDAGLEDDRSLLIRCDQR